MTTTPPPPAVTQAMLHSLAHQPSPQGAAVPDVGLSCGGVSSIAGVLPEPPAVVQSLLSPAEERELSEQAPDAAANLRSFLTQHLQWYAGAQPALEAWCRWSPEERDAHWAAHGGLDVAGVLNAEGVEWAGALGQVRAALLRRGVAPGVAASVTAEKGRIIIWDSGSKKSFSD
jgi:hypothetical protein